VKIRIILNIPDFPLSVHSLQKFRFFSQGEDFFFFYLASLTAGPMYECIHKMTHGKKRVSKTKAYGGFEVKFRAFLTSTQDEGERSASGSCRLLCMPNPFDKTGWLQERSGRRGSRESEPRLSSTYCSLSLNDPGSLVYFMPSTKVKNCFVHCFLHYAPFISNIFKHCYILRCPFVCSQRKNIVSERQEKSAGSGVGMNGDAVLFHETCVHPSNTIRFLNILHYWRLLAYNVFGTGIGGVHMRSKITPSPAPTSQRTSLGARTVRSA
jgi:hypothetical protein